MAGWATCVMENPRRVPDPSPGGCYRRPPQVAHIYSWSRSGSCDGHHKMVDCEPRIREPAPVRDRGGPREPSRLPLRPEGSAWETDGRAKRFLTERRGTNSPYEYAYRCEGSLCASSGHSLSTIARISSEMVETFSTSSMYLCSRRRSAGVMTLPPTTRGE